MARLSDRLAAGIGAAVVRWRGVLGVLLLLGLTVGWLRPISDDLATREGALLATASVVPIVIIVALFSLTDRRGREPWTLLLWAFFLGMAVAVLAAMVNHQYQYLPAWLLYVLVVGPGEEALKLGAVYVGVYRRPAFDDREDGIYYGAAAGAGFAAIETVTYTVPAHEGIAWSIVLVRNLLSMPAHAAWTGIAGFFLSRARHRPEARVMLVTKGLLAAIGLHAAFDIFVSYGGVAGIVAAGALTAGCIGWLAFALVGVTRDGHAPHTEEE